MGAPREETRKLAQRLRQRPRSRDYLLRNFGLDFERILRRLDGVRVGKGLDERRCTKLEAQVAAAIIAGKAKAERIRPSLTTTLFWIQRERSTQRWARILAALAIDESEAAPWKPSRK
jgi:hypothetical protein